jgi:hypothetical protein
MRLYSDYIVSGIFLILLIINFAVAAPVLVQEKSQARVDVVHIPKYAMTMLGTRKRAGGLDEIFSDAESHFVRPENSANPEKSSATHPSSSSQPLGLADGPTDVQQPLPSIPYEPPQVPGPDRAPLNIGDELWANLIGQPEGHFSPEQDALSATRPPSISQMSGPSYGSMTVKKPKRPSLFKKPSISTSLADEWNEIWSDIMQDHFLSEPESSAAHPWSSSQPSELADGPTDVHQPLPSIPNEPPQVPSPFREPPSQADEWNEIWGDFIQRQLRQFPSESEESSAAHPSSSSQPSGPAGGSVDVGQPLPPIHEEQFPVSSQVHASPSLGPEWNKMWHDLIQSISPSKPEESSAAHPSSSSQPSGSAGGSVDVEQSLPPVHEEQFPVHSQVDASPSLGPEWNKIWHDLIQRLSASKPGESSAARPSSISQPSGSAGVLMDVEKQLLSSSEGPSQVSIPDHAPLRADDELMKMWLDITKSAKPEESSAARTLLGLPSGSSTESDHETVGAPPPPGSASPMVPPESSVLSKNPNGQWMLDFSSGKWKKP